mgnify:FL=1
MNIWVMSDLHIDTARYSVPTTPKGTDIIVVAGDVADGHRLFASWLARHLVPRGLPVIYVTGNHDYYGHDLNDDAEALYVDCGVELLSANRPVLDIAGVRLIGATLWTDYLINGDVAGAQFWAKRSMPDFSAIDIGMRRIRPNDLVRLHHEQRDIIESALSAPFDGPTVVVTHHAPHPKSLRSELFRDATDGSFASDLEPLILAHQPKAWIHGHVHHSRDYRVGRTRVVCNPKGYSVSRRNGRGEGVSPENPRFDPQLVIEV